MGKSQTKKKTRGERHNPMRVPDAHLGAGSGHGKVDASKEREMLPVLNKLKSPEYADRTWACAAICNLIQNDPATRRMFQSKNVVGELIERLTDDVDEVVVEASGALRNLAIDGGHELCAEMFNKGIMPHLTLLTGKISSTIDSIANQVPGAEVTDAQLQTRKHLLNLAENVISLIWCLAEANHKTLAAVNAAGVDGLLLRALAGREMLGQGVALAAAHALYSLSQDNWAFTRNVISQPAALSELVNIAQQDHAAVSGKGKGKGKANGAVEDDGRGLLTRVLVAGALRHLIRPGSKADAQVDIVALTNSTILPLVNSLLDIDLNAATARVSQLVTEVPETNTKLEKGVKTDHKSAAETALDQVERSLTTVVVGLEILTGVCAGLEDAELEGEGDGAADEADNDDDEAMDEDADDISDEALIEKGRDPTSAPNGSTQHKVATSVTLSHLLTTLSLPARLTTLASLHSLSFPPSSAMPSIHPPTTSILSVLHLRALETLNNLLLTVVASLPEEPTRRSQIAGVIPVDQVWTSNFGTIDMLLSEPQALSQKGQELRIEVLEMALGCTWGCAKIAPEALTLSDSQVKTLMDGPQVLRGDLAKTRCVDTLGALASRQTVSVEENKVIGGWLVSQIASTTNTELLIAILNAVIDVYSDETRPYDSVFVSEGYLDVLSKSVGRVRAEVRKIDRRKNLQLRAVGEEVYENLTAFIKYRRALRR